MVSIEDISTEALAFEAVLLWSDSRLVFTLNRDHLPEGEARLWRVGGVGGRRESGERLADCARRETREEAGVEVRVDSAAETVFVPVAISTGSCFSLPSYGRSSTRSRRSPRCSRVAPA
jgi:8-oxo-dGTP pyrophosphatase MutT (NUDIX family)